MAAERNRGYETRAVLAGAYKGKGPEAAMLTHVVDPCEQPLCHRVSAENLADPYATDVNAPATCKTCARRDPRCH